MRTKMRTLSSFGYSTFAAYIVKFKEMEINEKEVERIEQIWRNDFARLYEDKPRLYNQLITCTLDIGMTEIEPGIEMYVIVFYVLNEMQRVWIKANILFEMQDRFAEMAQLSNLTLSVEVEHSNESENEIL